ncbi:hypothetical protein ACHQM5_027830 [Ranunculus cassubicifolius]
MALKREDIQRKDVVNKKSYPDEHFTSTVGISHNGNGRLEELDSEKLKMEIKKWAKAVVAHARQVSGYFEDSSG